MFILSVRYAKEICDAIVSKCLTGRPKTVEKAQAVFLLWVELESVEVFLVRLGGFCFLQILVRNQLKHCHNHLPTLS